MTQGYRTARKRSRRLDMNWLNFGMPPRRATEPCRPRRSRAGALARRPSPPGFGAHPVVRGARNTPQPHAYAPNANHRANAPRPAGPPESRVNGEPLPRRLTAAPGHGIPRWPGSGRIPRVGARHSRPERGNAPRTPIAPRAAATPPRHEGRRRRRRPRDPKVGGGVEGMPGLSRDRDRGAAAGRCAWPSARPGRGAAR